MLAQVNCSLLVTRGISKESVLMLVTWCVCVCVCVCVCAHACVWSYECRNAPGSVQLWWLPRRLTALCVCVCVCVYACFQHLVCVCVCVCVCDSSYAVTLAEAWLCTDLAQNGLSTRRRRRLAARRPAPSPCRPPPSPPPCRRSPKLQGETPNSH